MSNRITQSMKATFDELYGRLLTAIEVCPDAVWVRKTGGFYYWHLLMHCFGTIDNFAKQPGEARSQNVFSTEETSMGKVRETVPSKAEILALGKTMIAVGDQYFDSLTDDRLFERHEGRSKHRGYEVTQHTALLNIIAHGYYHVGVCSMVLREHGIKDIN